VAQQDVAIILTRQFADGLSVAALVVDGRGDTLFFNEPAERIFAVALTKSTRFRSTSVRRSLHRVAMTASQCPSTSSQGWSRCGSADRSTRRSI